MSKLPDLALLFLNTALFLFVILKLRSCNVSNETEWLSLLLSKVKPTSVRLPLSILKYARKLLIVNSSVFCSTCRAIYLIIIIMFFVLVFFSLFYVFVFFSMLYITVHSSFMGTPLIYFRSKQTNLWLCQ